MTTTPTSPQHRRRLLQFSLRTLLVVMLVVGAGLEQLRGMTHLKGLDLSDTRVT
jgi:hypothetical protein